LQGDDIQAQQYGWLKDQLRFSWQIVPEILDELLGNGTTEQSQPVMEVLLRMKKLEIAKLKSAYQE